MVGSMSLPESKGRDRSEFGFGTLGANEASQGTNEHRAFSERVLTDQLPA
jgi:hypothetical protein